MLKSLRETLKEVGILEILIEHRNKRCVDKTKFICDYYELLKNDRNMILSFKGEYMNQYNWAETTNGYICRLVEEKLLSKISLLN